MEGGVGGEGDGGRGDFVLDDFGQLGGGGGGLGAVDQVVDRFDVLNGGTAELDHGAGRFFVIHDGDDGVGGGRDFKRLALRTLFNNPTGVLDDAGGFDMGAND